MKATTIVHAFTKQVGALAVLATLAVAGLAAKPVSAQVIEEPNRLVGSWKVEVTVANPQGVPPFLAVMSFHMDGTMQQSRPNFVPQFNALETVHFGAWKRLSATQYAVTDLAVIQGAPGNTALNGALIGTDGVSFQPVVSEDGNSFTAQWTSAALDTNGNLIVNGSGTMSGVRIQVQP